MALPHDHETRLERARTSLEALSLADAFWCAQDRGANGPPLVEAVAHDGTAPRTPWQGSDQTAMALALHDELASDGQVEPDRFVRRLVRRHAAAPVRAAVTGFARFCQEVASGRDWRVVRHENVGRRGALDADAALRAAPLGAYFADDLDRVVEQARLQAEATHGHPEGQAGAVAVAVAAAMAWRLRELPREEAARGLLEEVRARTPDGNTRDMVAHVLKALEAGRGAGGMARSDTPSLTAWDFTGFVLWRATETLDDFAGALWGSATRSAADQATCPTVASIVVLRRGRAALRPEWLAAREPLPLDAPGAV